MTGLQPGDLLRNERRRPQGEQERRRSGPAACVLLQYEGGHLQRLRHVAGKATVVLARHHPVEAVVEGESGLRADLADDGVGGKLVVRVQPDGDRPWLERTGRPKDRDDAAHELAPGSSRSSVGTT